VCVNSQRQSSPGYLLVEQLFAARPGGVAWTARATHHSLGTPGKARVLERGRRQQGERFETTKKGMHRAPRWPCSCRARVACLGTTRNGVSTYRSGTHTRTAPPQEAGQSAPRAPPPRRSLSHRERWKGGRGQRGVGRAQGRWLSGSRQGRRKVRPRRAGRVGHATTLAIPRPPARPHGRGGYEQGSQGAVAARRYRHENGRGSSLTSWIKCKSWSGSARVARTRASNEDNKRARWEITSQRAHAAYARRRSPGSVPRPAIAALRPPNLPRAYNGIDT
jgi:hypothetical protein